MYMSWGGFLDGRNGVMDDLRVCQLPVSGDWLVNGFHSCWLLVKSLVFYFRFTAPLGCLMHWCMLDNSVITPPWAYWHVPDGLVYAGHISQQAIRVFLM